MISATGPSAVTLLRTPLTNLARDSRIEEILRKERKRLGVRVLASRLGKG
jgi:hypothetical protein